VRMLPDASLKVSDRWFGEFPGRWTTPPSSSATRTRCPPGRCSRRGCRGR
jgi:hypothetical protein